jgi:type II secretory pathway pseudopilin PulG
MKNKKGQILLITVMLLATAMTIVLSISFKSMTETKITKLEEESQKALAAAESAIEVVLKENTAATLGSGSLSSISGFSGGAAISSTTSTTFTTPNIPKDAGYTFYLGNYDSNTNTIDSSQTNPPDQDITICFQSGATNPAIEVTLIKSSGVKKYIVDPSSRITHASTGLSCTPDSTNYSYSITIPGDAATGIGVDGKFLLVRVLYAPTKLLFARDINLPAQGRTVTSEVKSSTSTGVSKKIIRFQSYPQIPAEFFTTAF